MWIKDKLGAYINTEFVMQIAAYDTLLQVRDYTGWHDIKEYTDMTSAIAARDELIRKLGGEVIEV